MVARTWWYERKDDRVGSQLQRSKLGEHSDLPGLRIAAARRSAQVLREGLLLLAGEGAEGATNRRVYS